MFKFSFFCVLILPATCLCFCLFFSLCFYFHIVCLCVYVFDSIVKWIGITVVRNLHSAHTFKCVCVFIKRSFAFFLIVIFFTFRFFFLFTTIVCQSRGPLGAVARAHCTGDRSISGFVNFLQRVCLFVWVSVDYLLL